MSAAKHTPGPWTHNDHQILAGDKVIANCTYGARNSNNAADARLMSKSPEMLNALKDVHPFLVESKMRTYIGNLIAQAEGLQA
ncbi:hypothetical protein [uncultured Rhodoferax sp.]|uniref:hypothetical protein n=1 Tax=uncultured Rhodoferax sp. TaxID=223188 RepID=UPI0025D4246D|nr:hypothetical protein [uncultured Rhodoferax sp.]